MTTVENERGQFAYSDCDDLFSNYEPTVKEALQSALIDFPEAGSVFLGMAKKKTISHYLTREAINGLLDELNETAAAKCGEASEDWLRGQQMEKHMSVATQAKILEDDKARLDSLHEAIGIALEEWANKRMEQPGFFEISLIKEYTVEEATARIGQEVITEIDTAAVGEC